MTKPSISHFESAHRIAALIANKQALLLKAALVAAWVWSMKKALGAVAANRRSFDG